ncbi:MerR family transcriptional regulator [Collinsella ihumii]|uniref:MerR family transcriptional regulator n=1 Tax=Collinsella ihumii TaxID=1720204 RepID=A0AAW7JN09_9ACTN|nr:MerR family transcriptional regulator [Collinsella ihumii]MDN0068749.1 MerR family transcriptional regulator [Collinsella ihumii]
MTRRRTGRDDAGEELYLIGEVSRIGGVSQRSLRHYDELKIIEPDVIGDNGYRYYTRSTMLKIPVVNYLKNMGFTLEDISRIFNSDFGEIEQTFAERRDAWEREMQLIRERMRIIDDWVALIHEANYVLGARPTEVRTVFLPADTLLAMPYRFNGDFAEATINLEFSKFVADNDNPITGPVILRHESFDAWRQRCSQGEPCDAMVLQHAVRTVDPKARFVRPDGMYLATYHVGPFEELGEAYDRMATFADEHGYRLAGCSYERFVTDYWTTYDPDRFVAEVLAPIK